MELEKLRRGDEGCECIASAYVWLADVIEPGQVTWNPVVLSVRWGTHVWSTAEITGGSGRREAKARLWLTVQLPV